jgi:hypothetical protein
MLDMQEGCANGDDLAKFQKYEEPEQAIYNMIGKKDGYTWQLWSTEE